MLYRFMILAAIMLPALPALAAGTAPEALRPGGWVRLEPGARAVYVGVQGGTAPASVLRAADGSLLVFTGKTGNDFSRVLDAGAPDSGGRGAPEVASPAMGLAAGELRPFGLSNPEGPVLAAAPAAPREEQNSVAAFKPLRLSSYKRLLAYSGAL